MGEKLDVVCRVRANQGQGQGQFEGRVRGEEKNILMRGVGGKGVMESETLKWRRAGASEVGGSKPEELSQSDPATNMERERAGQKAGQRNNCKANEGETTGWVIQRDTE